MVFDFPLHSCLSISFGRKCKLTYQLLQAGGLSRKLFAGSCALLRSGAVGLHNYRNLIDPLGRLLHRSGLLSSHFRNMIDGVHHRLDAVYDTKQNICRTSGNLRADMYRVSRI